MLWASTGGSVCHVVIEVSEYGRVPATEYGNGYHSLRSRALQSCPDPPTSANVGYHPPLAPPQLPALAGLPPLAPEPEELFRGCFIVIPAGPISNTYPLETKCLRLSSSSRVVRSPKLARPRRVLQRCPRWICVTGTHHGAAESAIIPEFRV